ncbi:DUF3054 domain-containing protein [Natrialbaceae archaeon A-arb3/5]
MGTAVRAGGDATAVDRQMILLAVGDVALLSGLVAVGQLTHGVNPITEPVASLETIAPFVIGWLVVTAIAGTYTRGISPSLLETARTITVVWLAAANVGFLLRASPAFTGSTVWPFPLVMVGLGLVVLGGWRLLATAYLR